jgi:Cu(I)/Ag(I) efflux system membrane fusion protein
MQKIKFSFLFLALVVVMGCNTKTRKIIAHQEGESTPVMDPQIKEDKPGKCPICHMDLTPIKKNSNF